MSRDLALKMARENRKETSPAENDGKEPLSSTEVRGTEASGTVAESSGNSPASTTQAKPYPLVIFDEFAVIPLFPPNG
jgi:hypothetical protein